jgi:excinuclease ABC subunit B
VLVGVNLLREGIDLPEVGMVAILDADKEGFLRNQRSITQIAGRAARNVNGRVILYADKITDSIRASVEDSNRRREKQIQYNLDQEMIPKQVKRSSGAQSPLISDIAESKRVENMTATPLVEDHYATNTVGEKMSSYSTTGGNPIMTEEQLGKEIKEAKRKMEEAAKALDFTAAARHRDHMRELEKILQNVNKYRF